MPRRNPDHLVSERTRHGKLVWYVRKGHERRIRLYPEYGTPAFWSAYRAALEGKASPRTAKVQTGTIAWLTARYTSSSEWNGLKASTRTNRLPAYRALDKAMGSEPVTALGKTSIIDARERRAAKPHSANNFVLAVRALFKWAIANNAALTDPTEGVSLLKTGREQIGFHAWTEEEVVRFEKKWVVGTRERVAFDVLLYTGLRRGDAVRFGPGHVRQLGPDEWPEFTLRTEKTGMVVTAPMLPALCATLAKGPVGETTYITGQRGEALVKDSFSRWFKRACEEAGVPGRPHGLRKAGARRAAEAGATESQLNALYGWVDGSRESAVYTRTANRARMAREAVKMRSGNPAPSKSGAGQNSENPAITQP